MRRTQLVSVLLLAASAAIAAEHDADLRLGIALAPGLDTVEVENSHLPTGQPDPANNGSRDMGDLYGFALEPGLMFRSSSQGPGLVGGVAFFFNSVRGSRSNAVVTDKRRVNTYGLLFSGGPTFQWDWFRLELLPVFGIGLAHVKAEQISAFGDTQHNSERGWGIEYGLRAGVYADSDQGQVGVQIGWQGFRAKAHYDSDAQTNSDSADETYTGSGLYAAFVAGVAF